MKLIGHQYGQARARVLKVFRNGRQHSVKELDVQVMLQGGFDASFTRADNRLVVATDSVFAKKYSPSVQVTLFQMGEAALKAAPEVSRVHLITPNKHCLLINLQPLGPENKNELFVPTDEPHGQIEGTVAR